MHRGRKDLYFFIGAVCLQRTGAVISQGILRSFCKGCGASAKDTALKTQVGCNRKGCGRNAKVGSKRKWFLYGAVKTQRSAFVKLCDAPEEVLSALPMDLSIAIKNGSKEPK